MTSGETTWGYRELHVSRKLEHGPRHYNDLAGTGELISIRTSII